MTKEISKEVSRQDRFKIFCLYSLAQYTYTIESGERCVETVDGKTLKYIYDNTHQGNPQLILSDLSDISDEDAVEVAKMCIPLNVDYSAYSPIVGHRDDKQISIRIGHITIAIDLTNGDIHAHHAMSTFVKLPACNIASVIDFLRNPNKPSGNAYMLPAHGITDLFEAGIAVRKETIKK